jgi:hypothetical protein
MIKGLRRRGARMLLLATAMLAGAAGIALATIPGATGVINGCYEKRTGLLRVIDAEAGKTCTQWETPISWNQKGLKGDQGLQGLQGEKGDTGAVGPQGPQGETGATGAQGERGLQGEKGAKGDQGVPGIQGERGPQGEQGPQGPPGNSSTVTGERTIHFEAPLNLNPHDTQPDPSDTQPVLEIPGIGAFNGFCGVTRDLAGFPVYTARFEFMSAGGRLFFQYEHPILKWVFTLPDVGIGFPYVDVLLEPILLREASAELLYVNSDTGKLAKVFLWTKVQRGLLQQGSDPKDTLHRSLTCKFAAAAIKS